jgi:hypothetical protein
LLQQNQIFQPQTKTRNKRVAKIKKKTFENWFSLCLISGKCYFVSFNKAENKKKTLVIHLPHLDETATTTMMTIDKRKNRSMPS